MKKTLLILAIIGGIQCHVKAQSRLNAGAGYYGENITHPGFVLEFEYENQHSAYFSLPVRGDLGFRGFHLPYAALHAGHTHTINSY